jgi:hypothetical protein
MLDSSNVVGGLRMAMACGIGRAGGEEASGIRHRWKGGADLGYSVDQMLSHVDYSSEGPQNLNVWAEVWAGHAQDSTIEVILDNYEFSDEKIKM